MVFSDQVFLHAFLPLALALGLLTQRTRAGPATIFVLSLGFFYWSSGHYTLLLLASIAINYTGGLLIARRRERWVIGAAVAANLLLLGYFKYAYFLASQFDHVLSPGIVGRAAEIVLPIGISFYTFQGISYLVDVWRREIEPERDFVLFGAYLSFFPQLIAGPIVRFRDVARDFRAPKVSSEMFAAGAARFLLGLTKKIVIADTVAPIADAAFATPDPGFAVAWAGALAYTVQIYFDFSGYSDMAIGLGMMFGIRFPENFRHPYAASTVTGFWRRWHISLSTWFRDYVYIPLGGNRRGAARTYVNLGLVFLATGLWHGAAWTFVAWGAWHGLFLIAERVALGNQAGTLDRSWVRLLYFAPVVVVGWVLFRAEDIPQFLDMAAAMASPLAAGAFDVPGALLIEATPFRGGVLVLALAALAAQRAVPPAGPMLADLALDKNAAAARLGFVSAAVALAVLFVIPAEFSPFLYFRF